MKSKLKSFGVATHKKFTSLNRKVWIAMGIVLVIVITCWCLKGECGKSGNTVQQAVTAEATAK